MNLFQGLKIKQKLAILVLPLLVTLVFFLINIVLFQGRVVDSSGEIAHLVTLSTKNSALVHELQKERGLTAGYLGSVGKKFRSDLKSQYNQTDRAVDQWLAFLKAGNGALKRDEVAATIQRIQQRLVSLTSRRSEVINLQVGPGKALSFYSQTNQQLLSITSIISGLAEDAKITRELIAYEEFLQGKERAGIERAVLSNSFSSDAFAPGMFTRFVALVSEQNNFLHNFEKFSEVSGQKIYQQHNNHPSFADVEKFRDLAFARGAQGGFGVDAAQWFRTATARINQLKQVEDRLAEQLIEDAETSLISARSSYWFYGLLGVFVVLLSVASAWSIIRGINRQLSSVSRCISQVVTNSDLSVRAQVMGSDEIAQVAEHLNGMLDALVRLIKAIDSASDELLRTSKSVAESVQSGSQNILQQKDETSHLVTAVTQLTATAQEVAVNTSEAAEAASVANSTAQDSNRRVGQAVGAIQSLSREVKDIGIIVGDLNDNSAAITGVLDVIKSVAEQTNLLALNAAIEAARAGEQGRGFAVVADEVRSLAQRTQESTLEIEGIIGKFQRDTLNANEVIEKGQSTADQAVAEAQSVAVALTQIVEAIDRIHNMSHQIASAAEQQVAVNDEVNSNIVRINEMGEANAASFTHVLGATDSQESLAGRLEKIVAQFKVGAV